MKKLSSEKEEKLPQNIPIEDLIAEVQREYALRERVYPRFVRDGRLSQKTADYRKQCMSAILAILIRQNGDERIK